MWWGGVVGRCGGGGDTFNVCIEVATCFPSTVNTAASLTMWRFIQDIWNPARGEEQLHIPFRGNE